MLALSLLLQTAAVPPTIPVDPRGREVVDLFVKLCVEEGGTSTALHRLDAVPPQMARTMPSEELHRIEPLATDGWIVRSPHEGWAAVYTVPAKRTCVVTIREASPGGLKEALEASLRGFYARLGATVTSDRPDETRDVGGVTVRRSSWRADVAGHQMLVIASFGDKPTGAMQHHLTFTILH